MNTLFRRPVIAVLLPLALSAVALLVSWFGYYEPDNTATQKHISEVQFKRTGIDKRLSEQKKYQRDFERYRARLEIENQFNYLNNITRVLLRQLADNSEKGFSLVSIESNNDQPLKIILRVNDDERFYNFIEKLERAHTTDRLIISPKTGNNKLFTVKLYINKTSGAKL